MYIVILLLTVAFSAVAVGGNIPKADPYPSEKPVEVNINPAIKRKAPSTAIITLLGWEIT